MNDSKPYVLGLEVHSSVYEDLDATFTSTFAKSAPDSKLTLKRLRPFSQGQDLDPSAPLIAVEVASRHTLKQHSILTDSCQIFSIGQKHAYSRLSITRELFNELIHEYGVFTRFWDFLVPFSFKTRESDLMNAPFRFRSLEQIKRSIGGSFECAYGFRYVELNPPSYAQPDNPDYDPWSIRQSVVYQRYDRDLDRNVFILIAPSNYVRQTLEEAVQKAQMSEDKSHAFDLHRILISTRQENWRLYIRALEDLIQNQSERIVLAQVQDDEVDLSPLTNFPMKFIDRQRLKVVEDKVLDLFSIFESLNNTLSSLRNQCAAYCLKDQCQHCICPLVIEELEAQIQEATLNLKRADALHKRAQGLAGLLSDLLAYKNAQIAHLNEKALNSIMKETQDENSKLRALTERSTADAAAVKILTIITLTYLPMTVVAASRVSAAIMAPEFAAELTRSRAYSPVSSST